MQEVVIPLSKKKAALLIAGAVAFVSAAVWIWSCADGTTDAVTVKWLAAIGAGIFGICGVYGCFKVFDDKPGLVVDVQGIVDNSSAVAVGRVPWSDISAITVGSISHQRFLTIHVHDPRKYIAGGGFVRRWLNAANAKLTGSPINIASNSLALSFDELELIVKDAFRTHSR
jgi:hypothetical protein